MIKQVTTTTLIVASAALANAASTTTLLTTTFFTTPEGKMTATTAKAESLLGDISSHTLKTAHSLGTVTYGLSGDGTVFDSNKNLKEDGDYWAKRVIYDFDSNFTSTINLYSIEVDTCLFNSDKTWLENGSSRDMKFTLSLRIGNDVTTFSDIVLNKTISGSGNKVPASGGTLLYNFNSIVGASGLSFAGKRVEFALVANNVGADVDTYAGLTEIRFNGTAIAIPEPSMFGLLAGLGTLALVGARRRRK